jgi:hypothetical protein
MDKHLEKLLSVGKPAHSTNEKPTLRARAAFAALATGLAVLLPACGFGGGEVNSEPVADTAPAADQAAAATASPAQVAETAAPAAPSANTASRTDRNAAPAASTPATQTAAAAAPTPTAAAPTASASAPAAPTSTNTVVATGKTNSVDTIVNDMKLRNDLVLAGIPLERGWATGTGQVTMGNDPRGTRTPSWWNPADGYFKSGAYWTQIVPWMVIFDGVGNAATNTRVEMRNMKAYYKSRSSGQWILLSQGQVEGANYPKWLNAVQVDRPDIVSVGGGVVSVRPPSTELHFHGWCCARSLPAPADIAAIHVTLQARLTVHDSSRTDDRSAARYLVQVGGDYYPDASLNVNAFAPVNWNPGIGLSRSKLVGNTWQSYSFTTINVGYQDPGGASISEAELRLAPPPLD